MAEAEDITDELLNPTPGPDAHMNFLRREYARLLLREAQVAAAESNWKPSDRGGASHGGNASSYRSRTQSRDT